MSIFQVLIVPGSVRDQERKFRAKAAGFALKNNITENLILCGGKTAKVIESKSMLEMILKEFPGINKSKIYLEQTSTDTSSNIENSIKIIKKNNWKKVGILSSKYHLKRCVKLAKSFGLNTDEISVEEVFNKFDPEELSSFNNYLKTDEMKKIFNLENIFYKVLIFDHKGRFSKLSSELYYKIKS